uniref:Chromosome 4 open reading frame 33 n=1 Tax=Naja naja TaxID=35670 RepID=A0A8C6VEK6_NAJNA
MEFKIEHTWNSLPVSHDPIIIRLSPEKGGILMELNAPFFNDPPAPPGEPGKPFNGLWDYEVVEAFFLNYQTQQYLEVELCPHGQHLVLFLCGKRNICRKELPLKFEVSRATTKWRGRAHLPWNFFPPNTDRFNAFAIHGSDMNRTYEALYPIPQNEVHCNQKPDFHCLEYFKNFSFKQLMGEDWKQIESDLWESCVR